MTWDSAVADGTFVDGSRATSNLDGVCTAGHTMGMGFVLLRVLLIQVVQSHDGVSA